MQLADGSARKARNPALWLLAIMIVTGCTQQGMSSGMSAESEGPSDQGPALPGRIDGDAALGRDVFRNETFGNEGFWTDAVRLPAGIAAARVTPMQALSLGLQIDVDAIDAPTQRALTEQLRGSHGPHVRAPE